MGRRIKGRLITLTGAHLEAIRTEKRRTQAGSIALLKIAQNIPQGVNPDMIERWLRGGSRTALKRHYEFVLSAYRALPDGVPNKSRPIADADSRIAVTEDMRKHLAAVHARAPSNYLDYAPEGFSGARMCHVLSGRDKTIPVSVWAYLQNEFDAGDASWQGHASETALGKAVSPDLLAQDIPVRSPERPAAKNYKVRQYPGTEYVEITDALFERLHAELRRTRVSHKRLLRTQNDIPPGLRALNVGQWFAGKTRAAEKHYLEYILNRYAELPDAD